LSVHVLYKTRKTVIGGAERRVDAGVDVPVMLIDAAMASILEQDDEDDEEEEEDEDDEQHPRKESLNSLNSRLVNKMRFSRSTNKVAKSRFGSLVKAFANDSITS